MSDKPHGGSSRRRKRYTDVYIRRTGDRRDIDFDGRLQVYVEEVRAMCGEAIAHWHDAVTSLRIAPAANRQGEPLLNAETAEIKVRRDLKTVIPLVRDNLQCLDQLYEIAIARSPDALNRVEGLLGQLDRHAFDDEARF